MSGDVRLFDGEGAPVLSDELGRLQVCSGISVFHKSSTEAIPVPGPYLVTSWGIPAGPVRLLKAFGYTSAPGQFVQLHDAAALPANGTKPIASILTASGLGQNWVLDFSQAGGFPCANGIWLVGSSTGPFLTLSPAVNLLGVISYSVG